MRARKATLFSLNCLLFTLVKKSFKHLKMQYEKILKNTLMDPSIILNIVSPSYLERFLPEMKNRRPFVILHKKKPDESERKNKIPAEDGEHTDSDITGSPLEYSFGKDSFNESVISVKRYWRKKEEYHLPMDIMDARRLLRECVEVLKPELNLSLFALCDHKDKQQTVLLGSSIEDNFHKTFLVRFKEPKFISQINFDCSDLLNEHVENLLLKPHNVETDVICTYELFGTREAFMDWTEFSKDNFEGYVNVEFTWNTPSFHPPLRQSKKKLYMEIAAGSKESSLKSLWDEILLINLYLTILEEYSKKNLNSRYSVMPLKFPLNFNHPYIKSSETVMDNLNQLLIGDYTFLEARRDCSEKTFVIDDLETDIKLLQYLKNLPFRRNLDFTDYLWMILRGSTDHDQITDCIHTLFEEIEKQDYKPQMNIKNSTRLAKIISDINQKKATAPSLAGSLPLEILIDLGIEKLKRDYTYLVLTSSLISRHELQEKFKKNCSTESDFKKYKKNLLTLAQINISLEFAFLAQAHLDYPTENLKQLFSSALEKFTIGESSVENFELLSENRIFNLEFSIPYSVIKHIIKGSPSTWLIKFSSELGITKLTTGTYYSLTPIFPPDIQCQDDDADDDEEFYFAASIIFPSYRIKQ